MDEATVVITGGTGGLGSAVADAFCARGATVVIGAREATAVAAMVETLQDRHPEATVEGLRTDVRDEFDCERLLETASRTGAAGVDVVVACAGVYHGDAGATPTDEEPYSRFDDHWRTNARGVFATVTEALPHLNDEARILLPTGAIARAAKPGYGSYAMSKAAGEAVVRGFAADTDHVVGCLEPGQLATALTDNRGRDPSSVAEMFVWAATDCDPSTLDGGIVDLKTWKQATR